MPVPAAHSPQMASTSSSSTSGKKIYRPLSISGMPKDTRTISSHRPNRYSALGFPSTNFAAATTVNKSPDPASPPMSTKSSATSIDSEPSTPAYSPRSNCEWDSPTLVILQPISSSSEPPSPSEPLWEMMKPVKAPQTAIRSLSSDKHSDWTTRGPVTNPLSCHPVKSSKSRAASSCRESKITDLSRKENNPPPQEQSEDNLRDESQEDKTSETNALPLSKLTAKMKLMLRRSNTSDKSKPKKARHHYEVERMDDTHWTEM